VSILIVSVTFLIPLLYTKEFLVVKNFIFFVFIAHYLMTLYVAFNMPLLAMERLKAVLFLTVFHSITFITLTMLLIKDIGIKGVAIAYLLAYVVISIAILFYLKRIINFSPNNSNVILFISSIIMLFLAKIVMFKGIFLKLPFLGLLIIWMLLFIKREEISEVKGIFKRVLRLGNTI
jgi:O-antigen/teichoic acid export membrane protein